MYEHVLPLWLEYKGMNKKTRALTLSALFTALCVITLYFASVWPTGQLGIAAFASLFVAAAVIESGLSYGILVYIVSSGLGMLLLPVKTAPLLYALFFGFYPVLKHLAGRVMQTALQWALKILVFNAALTAVHFLIKDIFHNITYRPGGIVILYLGANVVFTVFDYGYSKVLRFYMERIHNRR